MKTLLARRFLRLWCFLSIISLAHPSLDAATLIWDTTAGDGESITDGSGIWTNGLGNWNNGFGNDYGAGNVNWNNTTPDAAIFGSGGTAGTVTLGGAVTVANMAFHAVSSGIYTIAGGGNILTLSNSTITTNTNAVVSAVLNGTTGLIKDGTGTLTLSGANTYNGTTTLSSGILAIDNNGTTTFGALGNGTVIADSSASVGGKLQFKGIASAGGRSIINNGVTIVGGSNGHTEFYDGSSAGSGTFTVNGSGVSGAHSGAITFYDHSTAADGSFAVNAGTVSGALGGNVNFNGTSSAGNGTFTNYGNEYAGSLVNGDGQPTIAATVFNETSTAGNATLIAHGGTNGGMGAVIAFFDDSLGGTARVEVFANGRLDISTHNAGSLAVGSIEGTGNVFLGSNNLTVGNSLNQTFSGVIQDDGINFELNGTHASGGSFTKNGTGTLTLSGANTYTGGTTISGGILNVKNTTGSATGSGTVTVDASGTLAGTGIITTGSGNYIYINGALQVGDSTLGAPVVSSFELHTSGTGRTVLGAGSLLKFDLFQRGGDLTGTVSAADYVELVGTLDSFLGGTLILDNPNALGGFAAGDMWQLFDITGGSITSTLAVDYSALGLTGGLIGSFNKSTGIFSITDAVPEPSRVTLLFGGFVMVLLRRKRRS